ncbi:MAG: hypothetical protein WKF96_16055 [Solirubrobacteraceae bacterium]
MTALYGAARLRRELELLGYAVAETEPDFLSVHHVVEVGPLAGEQVELGWKVPGDFPASAPGGLLVRPHLLAVGQPGEHPLGAIHLATTGGVADEMWQYWSRPHADWLRSTKDARALLGHVRRLFHTLPADLTMPHEEAAHA